MFGRPGTAALLFDALAREYINVLMISQSVSEAGISVALRREDLERARDAARRQLAGSEITAVERVSIVALVGAGMRGVPGVAGRLFGVVAAQGANVVAIAQGSNELSISLAVREDQADAVVRALHAEFDPT
jgi:aspartate kinase